MRPLRVNFEDHQMSNLPAFPTKNYQDIQPIATGYSEGMTLRDYFAAKAMQVLTTELASTGKMHRFDDAVAESAYAMADAMLKAREA